MFGVTQSNMIKGLNYGKNVVLIFFLFYCGYLVVNNIIYLWNDEINEGIEKGAYSKLNSLGAFALATGGKTHIVAFKPFIRPNSSLFLWVNPNANNTIDLYDLGRYNYYFYPVILKTTGSEFKAKEYEYIICRKYEYETLRGYLIFFGMSKRYKDVAEAGDYMLLSSVEGMK